MINPFIFKDEESRRRFNFVAVDEWRPLPDDLIFFNNKGSVYAPVNNFYSGNNDEVGKNQLDFFLVSSKKCYNSIQMREHSCHYLNYFEKFYDKDKEYFSLLCHMKYLMDYYQDYRKESFLYDLKRYILSPSIIEKTTKMTNDNYTLDLNYKNITNPSLQYSDEDAKLLMQISVLMNLVIPLVTHFAYLRKITDIDEFLLESYDIIFCMFRIDMFNKLYETSITNIQRNEQSNMGVWAKQDIRGKNVTTHSLSSVKNIILNIMPKYVFNQNVVSMNYTSITNNTAFQVTDIEFEYTYIPLSSSKRDEDNASEFDKIFVA